MGFREYYLSESVEGHEKLQDVMRGIVNQDVNIIQQWSYLSPQGWENAGVEKDAGIINFGLRPSGYQGVLIFDDVGKLAKAEIGSSPRLQRALEDNAQDLEAAFAEVKLRPQDIPAFDRAVDAIISQLGAQL